MKQACPGSVYVLGRGTKGDKVLLVGPRTTTGNALAKIFKPFEQVEFISLVLDPESRQLEIQLPRFDLSFSLAEQTSCIRSKQYPGLCVKDQNPDSLIGLRTRLVLRPEDDNSGKEDVLLVPDGQVKSSKLSYHPMTTIILPDQKCSLGIPRQRYHCYRLDPLLGRLVDNGSLDSKLMLAHLHAVTSHSLPDGLTGLTGTEAALKILRSAAVRSFERLNSRDVAKL